MKSKGEHNKNSIAYEIHQNSKSFMKLFIFYILPNGSITLF